MSFQVSDKVVCVDDVPGPGTRDGDYWFPNGFVKKGKVYVVSEVRAVLYASGHSLGLFLVGLPAILKRNGRDIPWPSYRFRKLSDIQAENAARAREEVAK